MRTYIARRLLLMLPALLLVSILIFFLVNAIPGSIVDVISAQGGLEGVDKPTWEGKLGLTDPVLVQYGRWMGFLPKRDGTVSGLLQGDLGESWWKGVPVAKLAATRWPVTLELGLMGLIIAQLISLPIGIYSALRQDRLGDYVGRTFAILCISIPEFWVGTLVVIFPALWWNYMPSLMLIRFIRDPLGNLGMFLVPAAILGMGMAGGTMRMTRTMMLEVLKQDYIRTAWAKGLKEKVVVVRHAVKNALIPVVTIVGLQVPVMIGGTVIIEQIFGLPGMGRLMIDALNQRDEPLVTGLAILFAFGLMLVNLATDLTYAFLDPRIRYK